MPNQEQNNLRPIRWIHFTSGNASLLIIQRLLLRDLTRNKTISRGGPCSFLQGEGAKFEVTPLCLAQDGL